MKHIFYRYAEVIIAGVMRLSLNIRLVHLSFLGQQAATTDHSLTLRSQLIFLATPWHRTLPSLHLVS
jgi:hypothetical protein